MPGVVRRVCDRNPEKVPDRAVRDRSAEIVDQPVVGLQRAPLTLQYVVLSAVVITEPHKPRPLEFPE